MKDYLALKSYYRCQTEICYTSELFGDHSKENEAKVLTLNADIFPTIVDIFGLDVAKELLINFENTRLFKKWFWQVKYTLGTKLGRDPDYFEIGEWLGKGFFLKLILSAAYHDAKIRPFAKKLSFSKEKIEKLIKIQKKFLNELKAKAVFFADHEYPISECDNCYFLLGEKVALDINDVDFTSINLIY